MGDVEGREGAEGRGGERVKRGRDFVTISQESPRQPIVYRSNIQDKRECIY